MAAVWQLRESRRLGGSDKVWKLSKEGEGISVGRATYCDVQILSHSVEKKHSVIKWDQKKEAYEVRDLGSVDGTFLNDIPLSNGVGTLSHGDTLRFGCDTGHLFHVERVESPSPVPPAPQHTSCPTPSHCPSSAHTSPAPTCTCTNSPTPPQVPGVQYVPIPSMSPSLILPAVQPYIIPQPIYSPHIQQIGHMTGHVTTTAPSTIGCVSPYGSVVSPSPVPTTPLHLVQYPIPPGTPLTTSTHSPVAPTTPPTNVLVSPLQLAAASTEPRTQHYQSESTGISTTVHNRIVSPRRDGRRSISLSSADMPLLSEVSSLYGQPSWWGEEERETVSTKKSGNTSRRPRKSEPQIFRDISPPHNTPFDSESSPVYSSSKAVALNMEGAEKLSSRRKTAPKGLKSSWTVETGSRRSRAVPLKLRRHVRSADSSPIRRPDSAGRSISSNVTPVRASKSTAASNKDFTPLSRRVTASKPPSGSDRREGKVLLLP